MKIKAKCHCIFTTTFEYVGKIKVICESKQDAEIALVTLGSSFELKNNCLFANLSGESLDLEIKKILNFSKEFFKENRTCVHLQQEFSIEIPVIDRNQTTLF